ncbi:MAG: hypothetical protein ACX939_01690 [Hyphococcus sp.]
MTNPLKSQWKSLTRLTAAVVVLMAGAATLAASTRDAALHECVDAAIALGGDEYRKVTRVVEQNASVLEFWVAHRRDRKAPRIYCRINLRVGEIEQVANLEEGAYRPQT